MPDGNSLDLANFLQNAVKGDRNSDGWGANGGMLWIFLLILFGFGGFGAGGFGGLGRGGAGAVVNDAAITGAVETAIAKAHAAGVTDQLMLQAINGNKEAIDKMSIALNCDSNRINDALCSIKGGIDKVAGEVGMTSQQVINAIQASWLRCSPVAAMSVMRSLRQITKTNCKSSTKPMLCLVNCRAKPTFSVLRSMLKLSS